jgi:hypothetical protein
MRVENREKKTIKSKKDMILSLFETGITQIETISAISGAKPSYVGAVLQKEGLIDNYFDLYTSTSLPMNIYSKHFQGKLGFKNLESAGRSIRVLESAYRYFDQQQDRAGQHHALELGLTMLDRARWTGKLEEAEVYRQWLVKKLSTPLIDVAKPMEAAAPAAAATEGPSELAELADLKRAA